MADSPPSGTPSAAGFRPQASVIVLSYNSRADLPECLSAVLAQTGAAFELVVVDNCSTDGSADWVASTYLQGASPQGVPVKMVRSSENGGYAAGNNLGAKSASGQVLVFLNPDTVVQPGWLLALLDCLKANPDAAGVCSKVVFADNPERVNSAGLFMSRLGFSGSLGDGQPASSFASDLPIFAPSGCALAISAERFRELNGFDESFFLYQEDLDLGWRAANRGWRSMLAAQSVVWHKYQRPRDKSRFYYYATRNLARAIRKNMSGFERYHLLGHYTLFSLALAFGLLLTLRPSSSLSVLRGLAEGLTAPARRDAMASSAGWGRMFGLRQSVSILLAKMLKHA